MDQIVSRLHSGVLLAYRHISSPVAYCALSIKAGTRDEETSQAGIAHFTEHMLFKGTQRRSALSVNGYLEKLGGEINAYTTKEETVIHATVLKEDISKAIDLISDLAFNALFPQKEADNERGVILEEISSYKDTPAELIFEDFDEMIFGEHPLSIPILGFPKSVKKIDSVKLAEFRNRHYILPKMSFSIVADIDFKRAATLVDKYFKGQNNRLFDLPLKSDRGVSHDGATERERVVSRKTFQAHCVTGSLSYSYYDPRRYAAALITNMLGGPALNSRLNTLLREKHALAYSVDASNNSFTDTGLFSVYFGTDKNNIDKCLNLVKGEFLKLANDGITPSKLKAAKKQLLGQLAIASDNAEAQCLNMGKSLLVFGRVDTIEEIRSKIEGISAGDVLNVAGELFDPSRLFTIIYK